MDYGQISQCRWNSRLSISLWIQHLLLLLSKKNLQPYSPSYCLNSSSSSLPCLPTFPKALRTCWSPYTTESVEESCHKKYPVKSEMKVAQSCPTHHNPMDCSPPGFSVHGIFQARIPEWVAFSYSRGSSWPRDYNRVSCIGGQISLTLCYLGEKAMATHSSTLAWKIPWTEEPGRLRSMGSLRVGHDWASSLSLFTFMHWRRKWQPTPMFLPGESQGQGSLVGCRLWGRTESGTTEVT